MARFSKRRAAAVVVSILAVLTTAIAVPTGAAAADPLPHLQLGSGAIVEGDTGRPVVLKVPLTLSEPAAGDVTVEWTLAGTSASAGDDFKAKPKPGRTKIRAGKVSGQISVQVFPDTTAESNETFQVTLTHVLSGPAEIGEHAVGTGTILDDDSPSAVAVGIGDITTIGTLSGLTKAVVPITLTAPLATSNVEVTWNATGGTAGPGTDFKALSKPKKTIIKAGKTKANATMTILANTADEPDESFDLTISNVTVTGTPAPVAIAKASGVVTIKGLAPAVVIPSNLFEFGYGPSLVGPVSQEPWTVPETISSELSWSSIANSSGHALGIKSDGSLWGWGESSWDLFDAGEEVDHPTPVQIGTASWRSAATGLYHSLGVRTDGTLWSWGNNRSGQLGTGVITGTDTLNRATQIGTDDDWAFVASHVLTSFAIKTDGSLWSWGYNAFGQLGLGDTYIRSTPERVGIDNDWAEVSAGQDYTLGRKTDGTLWAWGLNGVVGLLGLGDTAARLVPTQIGTDSNWSSVSAGPGGLHSAALKADGTVWTWGWNGEGQLGLGDYADRLVPTQVGSSTDWQAVAVGSLHTLALKTDGTLWSWGSNAVGELGSGDLVSRNLPDQVGSDSDWAAVFGGNQFSQALKS